MPFVRISLARGKPESYLEIANGNFTGAQVYADTAPNVRTAG